MDRPIKVMQGLIIGFMGVMIFVSIITFTVRSSVATQALYESIKDIEENGYVESNINTLAHKTNTSIAVVPVPTADGNCYKVTVSFRHIFAIIKMDRNISRSATTRIIEY